MSLNVSQKFSQKNSRREFFKNIVTVVGFGVIAPSFFSSLVRAEEKRRGGGSSDASAGGADLALPIVEPGKDTAVAMRYYHNHGDAQKDKNVSQVEKNGVPWGKQFCKDCSFYKSVGKKKVSINGKSVEVEVGTCAIFPQKLVASEGICNSWAKRA